MMRFQKFFTFLMVVFFGATLFVTGFYFGRGDKIIIDPSERIDFSLFGEVYYLLEQNFPGFKQVSDQELEYGVVRGLLDALGDPHTSFFDPEKSKIFLEDVAGEFQGVGIEIGIRDNNLQVISPLKNTPAYRAGLRAGDIILTIDEESAEGISLEEAVVKIRGPEGEPVTLEIFRDNESKEVTIIRETIKIPSLEWELINEDIAYIQFFHFHENISSDFANISRDVLNSPAEKIILDLRNNPGGLFSAAISISSKFIETGEVVVIETGTGEAEDGNFLRTTRTPPIFLDYPVVVLINEGTASASEILAGALRDQRDIPIIGMNSFGKGSIQRMHSLGDGSVVKITEKYFLTPKGEKIDGEGISPDFEVEITEEDIEAETDPQLEKAIEIIREKE